MSQYPDANFIKSANALEQFVADQGAEVAVAGRSNAGKSSAINVIVNRRQFARTSKTPGRTQLVNFFHLRDGQRLVDLPESAGALQKARDAGAYCAWLSGSGPTVAALCGPSTARQVASRLPEDAEIAIATIEHRGARCW